MTVPVLLVTAGIFHPPLLGRLAVENFLRSLDEYKFRRISSMEGLQDLDPGGYCALVLYFHHRAISPAALSAFERFVCDGGGVLAVHSATASFKGSTRYYEILGGRFVDHGSVQRITLLPTAEGDGIFEGLGPFAVEDELYRHEFYGENTIHFVADVNGERLPQVWTRRFERGRVCYLAPGHLSATMRRPEMREILRRGLAWVAG
jgi:type 1 glutamine amidotransferase